MGKNRFYVVWSGRKPGIYSSWEACRAMVEGFEGARYMGFETRAKAEEAYAGHFSDYYRKGVGSQKAKLLGSNSRIGVPLPGSLTVDAACSGNPGVMEYRGVWLDDGSELFRMGPYPEGTVNIGEFLAIVHGLALLQQQGSDVAVYTDSMTAMKWVRDCRANTKLQENDLNKKLFEYIRRAESWLKKNRYPNPVLKWNTKHWGEIPADYGRK